MEREVYTVRAAEAAGLTAEALRLETQRAFKRRIAKERKARERRELNPAITQQPDTRGMRYDNLRSAMAEEGVLRLLLLDDSLFSSVPPLQESDFSSPLLGRVFARLWQMRPCEQSRALAVLGGELTGEEMNHLTAILQKPESMPNAPQALADYIRIIREEKQRREGTGQDLLALARDTYKEKKGYGGKQHE